MNKDKLLDLRSEYDEATWKKNNPGVMFQSFVRKEDIVRLIDILLEDHDASFK
jgi:hypothetical protein